MNKEMLDIMIFKVEEDSKHIRGGKFFSNIELQRLFHHVSREFQSSFDFYVSTFYATSTK